MPAIKAKVIIPRSCQEILDKEIPRVNGNKKKDLEEQVKGEKLVNFEALRCRRKVAWSRTVKKLGKFEASFFQKGVLRATVTFVEDESSVGVLGCESSLKNARAVESNGFACQRVTL